jgi:hypothetical protein
MFARGGFGEELSWNVVGSQLLTAGTSYLTAEMQKQVAKAQAAALAAQQAAQLRVLEEQRKIEEAKALQTAGMGFDIGKMTPLLIVGIGVLIFMTMKEGTRKRR